MKQSIHFRRIEWPASRLKVSEVNRVVTQCTGPCRPATWNPQVVIKQSVESVIKYAKSDAAAIDSIGVTSQRGNEAFVAAAMSC